MKRVPYNHEKFMEQLQGFVRRSFTRDERRAFPDVRIVIATPVEDEDDPKLSYDNLTTLVIRGNPIRRRK